MRARPGVPAWQRDLAALETATPEQRVAVLEARRTRWVALQAGLPLRDGIRALLDAGEISDAHAAMLTKAVEER